MVRVVWRWVVEVWRVVRVVARWVGVGWCVEGKRELVRECRSSAWREVKWR